VSSIGNPISKENWVAKEHLKVIQNRLTLSIQKVSWVRRLGKFGSDGMA